jgi:hypothetical protein
MPYRHDCQPDSGNVHPPGVLFITSCTAEISIETMLRASALLLPLSVVMEHRVAPGIDRAAASTKLAAAEKNLLQPKKLEET